MPSAWRYRYVYAKLRDFEDYLISFGVDTTLRTAGGPARPAKNVALLNTDEVVTALRRTAVDHNIRLMHRLGHEQLFGNTLEAARGEKNPARLQAYVSIFEEYFTYWNASQKQQTLDFLYELLLIPDGDIRRRPPPSSDASWPPSAWAIRRSPRPTPRRTRRKTCPSSCGRSTWKSSSTRTGG